MVVFTDVGNGSMLVVARNSNSVLRLLGHGDTLLALHPDRIARDTADLLTVRNSGLLDANQILPSVLR